MSKEAALTQLARIASFHWDTGAQSGKPTAAQLGVLGRLTPDEAALMARHLTSIHVIAGSKITQAAAKKTIGAGFTVEGNSRVIGLYWQSSRRLAVTERELDNPRSNTTMHEVGHALDHAYSQAAMSDEFHALDERVLGAQPNPSAHYHPAKNANGPLAATRERFAELYGQYKMGHPYDLHDGQVGHTIGRSSKLTADLNAYFTGLHAARAKYITAAGPPPDYLCIALDDGTYQQPTPEPEDQMPPGPQAAVQVLIPDGTTSRGAGESWYTLNGPLG